MNYIAIEGLDGAGKSTAMKAVRDFFSGREFEDVWEPGGTPLAELIRDLLKMDLGEEKIDEVTEGYLFFAARNQLLINKVIPALEKGKLVLSDRCYLSSIAYQDNDTVKRLSQELQVKPDFIIYLDIDPKVGLERAKGREELDRIEKKGLGFYNKSRANYVAYAEKHDYVEMVDAHGTIEEVYAAVYAVLESRFSK